DGVVIDVLPALAQRPQRLAAVVGDADQDVHHVDAVLVPRIDHDVGIVLRLLVELVAALPRLAAGGGAGDGALLVGGLGDGLHHVGVGRGDGQADAADLALRQAARQLAPRLAAVGGLVQPAFGAAIDERPDVPPPLVGGGDQRVGVARVEDHVGDA